MLWPSESSAISKRETPSPTNGDSGKTESTTIVGGYVPLSVPEHRDLSVGGAASPEKGIAKNSAIREMQ